MVIVGAVQALMTLSDRNALLRRTEEPYLERLRGFLALFA